ncbi:glycosyltransferase family 4 protein [Desulfosediminicola flagellatus]|uniref:glycosyltransferase family 4 protein n=1 Tax=Desulfosediminicola flagellatus TaxID=2569541 RepID=UPI0010AC3E73|nr:glycosyltransferase family 4 protein [Desulfosediminicola flagellatus]
MIKCHMTHRAEKMLQGKIKYDWVHLSISQDVPPITGGSYKFLVWELIKERAEKDVLICKYIPKSFHLADQSNTAVCQFDINSKDFSTSMTCRVNWLKSVITRKGGDVFLKSVAEWIRATGGKKILVWGGINSLPELRRLLPDVTIAYSQRHYGYPGEVSFYNYCDVLITQTQGQAKLAYVNSARLDPFVLTIPNGVELDQFSPESPMKRQKVCNDLGINPENLVVVFPSKIALYKGSRYLERLIEISEQMFPDMTFLVIGGFHNLSPPHHRKSLEKLLDSHPQVVWCGGVPREEMSYLLSAGDVCLMPATLREGFSMAGIEAMAAGLPLIATASGCYPEIIKDKFNGLLCEESELFENMISALKLCLTDRDLVKRMGVNARSYVENKLPRKKVINNYCRFLDNEWENIDSDMSV